MSCLKDSISQAYLSFQEIIEAILAALTDNVRRAFSLGIGS